MKKNIRERISEVFDMPKDLALDVPNLRVTGDRELIVENYKGIIEYDRNVVRLKTSGKIIKVQGHGLEIKTITDEDIMVQGRICCIEFV